MEDILNSFFNGQYAQMTAQIFEYGPGNFGADIEYQEIPDDDKRSMLRAFVRLAFV